MTRTKIIHYRQAYLNRLYILDDFTTLLFLHTHRETSTLTNELPEESHQFRLFHVTCLDNLKGSLGLILVNFSTMRISTPLNLSSRSFIPLPCLIRSRLFTPLLTPSLVFFPFCVLSKRHILGVYLRVLSAFLLIIEFFHYETIKWELNKRHMYVCRCDTRLKAKDEGSTSTHTLGCVRDWNT